MPKWNNHFIFVCSHCQEPVCGYLRCSLVYFFSAFTSIYSVLVLARGLQIRRWYLVGYDRSFPAWWLMAKGWCSTHFWRNSIYNSILLNPSMPEDYLSRWNTESSFIGRNSIWKTMSFVEVERVSMSYLCCSRPVMGLAYAGGNIMGGSGNRYWYSCGNGVGTSKILGSRWLEDSRCSHEPPHWRRSVPDQTSLFVKECFKEKNRHYKQ